MFKYAGGYGTETSVICSAIQLVAVATGHENHASVLEVSGIGLGLPQGEV